MLQQTRAAVVIPYFQRWMHRFPSIRDLACADPTAVIKEWEGLGYYSRARNLLSGARYVMEHYNGILPSSDEELKKIKGLGPYTRGAIRSLAFHQRTPAVDGNVMRVLARYYKIEDDITKSSTQAKIWQCAEKLLPEEEPWIVNEALIELGATLCNKKSACQTCPLKDTCLSYQHGVAHLIPVKKAKAKTQELHRAVVVISHEGKFLIRRVQKGEIMADLHEFPYFEITEKGISTSALARKIQKELGLSVDLSHSLPAVRHSFTRYQATLLPFRFASRKLLPVLYFQWVEKDVLKELAFSSGHRRILHMIGDP